MCQSEKAKKIFTILFVLILTIIPLSLCFGKSVWLDEGFSLRWSSLPFNDMMKKLTGDVHPPLYYFLLYVVLKLTGNSLLAARLLSVLALFFCFLIGVSFVKKNFGYTAMIFFNLFMLCTPMMLSKSVEVRMYTWAYLFVLLSAMEMYYLLGDNYTKKNWVIFTLASLAAAYTQYFALITMIFTYGMMLLFYIFTQNRKQVKAWIICSLATIIVYLPWLPVAINQVKSGGASWIPASTSRLGILRSVFTTDIPKLENVYILLLIIFFITGFIFWCKCRTADLYWSLVCMASVWIILIFGLIVEKLMRPILVHRFLMIPLCITILGMSCICKYVPKYLLCIPLLIFLITGFCVYPKVYAQEYDTMTEETLQFADEHFHESDVILYDSGGLSSVIPYYFPDTIQIYLEGYDVYSDDFDYLWYFAVEHELDMEKLQEYNIKYIDYGVYGFDLDFTIYYLYHDEG